jgi:ABC-type transport system involved in multi-copper enzyme maturation permease subunit
MRFLALFGGLALILLGIYFLGSNIIFTTHAYPWWRGVAADLSVISLGLGVLVLIFLPSSLKSYGWLGVITGILCVFLSSRAILNPTSLWQFFVALMAIGFGYKLLTTRLT